MMKKNSAFKLALICGGPSLERGISLNSARSVCDHLDSPKIKIVPVYLDHKKRPYRISKAQLYSNTPSDFDFKLASAAHPLSFAALKRTLRSVDLVFPAIHGSFGEDGGLQKLLEKSGVPFVGSDSRACESCFDKFEANKTLAENGFFTLPSIRITGKGENSRQKIAAFFKKNRIRRAIVKPSNGGSSIGVYSVATPLQAYRKTVRLLENPIYPAVVIEPFCSGSEFTVIVLENRFNLPVSLIPVEIHTDYTKHQIFDYRRKYLPTAQVAYHCPARFEKTLIKSIQIQAEQIFSLFGMKDFARLDGFVLKDGSIWFSDINPISGMEQNSFLFLSAAQLGMSHHDVLKFIVRNSASKYGIPTRLLNQKSKASSRKRKRVNVLFGGDTAERQVSLMSGTNVWLKLKQSKKFDPYPYLLDTDGMVWELPYAMTLNHTVEEISTVCRNARRSLKRVKEYRLEILRRLAPHPGEISEEPAPPRRMNISQFISESPLIFNTVHGGIGENGVLQRRFEQKGVKFNGCDSRASKLCMDKYETGRIISTLKDEGILSAGKKLLPISRLKRFDARDYRDLWGDLRNGFKGESLIVKPPADGCSAGIVRLFSPKDAKKYVTLLSRSVSSIPPGTLTNQHQIIEMPTEKQTHLLFEEFIETDLVNVIGNRLVWKKRTGWIEVTCGLLGRKGRMKALSPSITVASGDVLSLEEKFQGGTGINITPPPSQMVSPAIRAKAKKRFEKAAKALGLSGYARIDAFLNTRSGEIIVIEANTLPGLTPSTVIFHQALAEKPALYPREFIEKIIEASC